MPERSSPRLDREADGGVWGAISGPPISINLRESAPPAIKTRNNAGPWASPPPAEPEPLRHAVREGGGRDERERRGADGPPERAEHRPIEDRLRRRNRRV